MIRVVAATIFNDKKELLLCRKKDHPYYIFPGGKPETGEEDLVALCRELKEEINVELKNVGFGIAFVNKAPNGDDIFVYIYEVDIKDISTMKIGAEIVEIRWHNLQEDDSQLPYPFTPATKEVIKYLKDKG